MSDTRAAIRELRSLSEKRSTQGLTEQEQSRLAELRDRLGLPPDPPAGPQGPVIPFVPRPAPPAPGPVAGARVASVPAGGLAPSPRAVGAEMGPASVPEPTSPSWPVPAGMDAAGTGGAPWAPGEHGEIAPADATPTVAGAPWPEDGRAEAATTDAAGAWTGAEAPPTPETAAPWPEDGHAEAATADAAGAWTGAEARIEPDAAVTWPDGLSIPGEPATAWPPAEAVTPPAADASAAVPPEPPLERRSTLAERIEAEFGAGEPAGEAPAEAQAWGAAPMGADATEEAVVAPADLGAIPLDVADPAAESLPADPDGPIELSSADVVLLEPETEAPLELGGNASDPVQLAETHEFLGDQPVDPRALAFDEQAEEPIFAPQDLQTTEAELAASGSEFLPTAPPGAPEPVADPAPLPESRPPAPVAPRISVPRPPTGPPPPRPAPIAASPPAAGANGSHSKEPTAAPPQPPALGDAFSNSGPFARPAILLLTPAPLDVMDDHEPSVLQEVAEPVARPPATDVATGAEVFGSAYLNPTFVSGEHRVVLHTLEGQVRRGTVRDLDLLDPVIRLSLPGKPPEAISADRVKAIFFMQEPGAEAPVATGRRIRVGFADGRQIVGFSDDVDAGEQGFFLVPADTRTHTARIYLFRAGVQSITAA